MLPSKLLKLLFLWVICLGLSGCDTDTRLSAAVMFLRKNTTISEWLKKPQYYFLESYVRFDPQLDNSIIFGIDQELIEGTRKPIYVSGGDWMGLIGLQRDGKIWVATGTDETMQGKPSKDRKWVHFSLDQPLQPNTWYRFYSVVDYSTRHYVSFTVEGPDIKRSYDLRSYTLDYPNTLPFDGRAMTNLVWAIGVNALGTKKDSFAKVYFDDVRSGIVTFSIDHQTKEQTLFSENFETQTNRFTAQPWSYMDLVTDKVIALEKYQDGTWYLERDIALAKPATVDFARSGKTVAVMDATIEQIKYDDWLKR